MVGELDGETEVVGFADGLFDGWFEGPDVGDEDGAAVGV